MLASITPLGERGRRSSWPVTIVAFVIGATSAGAALGAVLGLAGSVLPGADGWRLVAFAAGALVALAIDAWGGRVPGPRRQVNERWLDEYRGWVYGVGYGSQLGLAVATIVSSAATYLALLAAVLTGRPAWGAVIVGLFGLLRGLTPLSAAHVRRPDQLLALHRRLTALRVPGSLFGRSLVMLSFGAALIGGLA